MGMHEQYNSCGGATPAMATCPTMMMASRLAQGLRFLRAGLAISNRAGEHAQSHQA